jgi:hypothetical protein
MEDTIQRPTIVGAYFKDYYMNVATFKVFFALMTQPLYTGIKRRLINRVQEGYCTIREVALELDFICETEMVPMKNVNFKVILAHLTILFTE